MSLYFLKNKNDAGIKPSTSMPTAECNQLAPNQPA